MTPISKAFAEYNRHINSITTFAPLTVYDHFTAGYEAATRDKQSLTPVERIKADAGLGLTDRIIHEAKNFAFYNYCSEANNPNANFNNLETWPFAAQVAYYAISNYMSGNPVSWPFGTKTIPMDLKDAAFETALEQWKVKEVEKIKAKEGFVRLFLAGANEVSKDAATAEEYLKSEGVDVAALKANAQYFTWKAELIRITKEKTGEPVIKINDEEAVKWYNDGFTPEQTFRETWQSDGD